MDQTTIPDFTNIVSFNKALNQGGMSFSHCLMHLEPRLQEYVKKRNQYSLSNIKPNVPLEQEYRVTAEDQKKIFMFDRCTVGQRKMNKAMINSFEHPDLLACVDNDVSGENGKNAYRTFPKFGEVKDTKTCYKPDPTLGKPMKYFIRTFNVDCGKDCKTQPRDEMMINEPGFLINGGCINQDKINDDSALRYANTQCHLRSGESCMSDMDLRYKYVIPRQRARCNRDDDLSYAFYQAVPYMGQGSGLGDVDMSTLMKQGTATNFKARKLGGITIDRFETLPRDMQDPDHIVLPFPRGGIDTRHLDKYARRHSKHIV
jgi:hypothetical protein